MKTIRKRVVNFTMNGMRCTITVEHRKAQHQGTGRTVDLKPIPKGAIELSICGDSGQCDGRYADLAGKADAPDVARLCQIWDRWHLNGMKAGTARQNEIAQGLSFDQAKAELIGQDLLVDQGYSYGSESLFDEVPGDILSEIDRILDRIADQRFGHAPSVDNAPDCEGDIIDSRDIIQRLEIYADALRDIGIDPDLPREEQEKLVLDEATDEPREGMEEGADWIAEHAALKALDDEAPGDDWRHGSTMVADSHFTAYAEQLAEDLGMVKSDAAWPNNFIDWDAAADALKGDYSTVTFRGVEYHVR